jgi:hypothetical protein
MTQSLDRSIFVFAHLGHLYICQIHVILLYLLTIAETPQTLVNFHYCLKFVLPKIDPKRDEKNESVMNENEHRHLSGKAFSLSFLLINEGGQSVSLTSLT